MKREGRQHGMVRSYRILPSPLNPRPNTRFITKFDSPPTAGLFIKVPSKPTNHSKFTGKCGTPRCTGCHLHPACKSKDKTKGTQKLKNWRVVDGRPGLNFSGFSATGMLDHLSNEYVGDEVADEVGDQVDYPVKDADVGSDDDTCISEMGFEFEMDQVEVEDGEEQDEDWCFVESCS